MFKNYIKTAFRSLITNKTYSILNITGLALGTASFILVILYVSYELSFDKFFKNSDNIYRVYMDYIKGGHFEPGDAQAYNQSGPTLKKEISEIKDYVRLYQINKSILEYNNKTLEVKNGQLADPSYFNIFNYPLEAGNPSLVLKEPNTIVLCESISKKLFGNLNPIGESITAYTDNRKVTLTVTGILKDLPENTHFKINYLVSFQTINTWHVSSPWELNWNNNNYFTYILVDKNANIAHLRKKIGQIDFPNKEEERHNIECLASIHLHSDKPYEAEANGSAVRVKFLFAIAIIIIVLSWLNYMNLTTSKSMERLKEVGVRKVSGARRRQLIMQFMSESVMLNLIAIIIASVIVTLSLPYLNAFTGKNLVTGLSWSNSLLLLIGIPILGIVVSGLYPAFILSAFKPALVLKGKMTNSPRTANLRQMFVVTQFLATIVLMIGTFVVIKQIKFLQNQPLGMNLNNIISIKGEILEERKTRDNKLRTLKGEIQKLAFVERVSTANTYPGEGYEDINTNMGVTYPNETKESRTVWYTYSIDENYIPLIDIKMIAGEQFSVQRDTNSYRVLMNEKAARLMGFTNMEDAVNQKMWIGNNPHIIGGIMNDFHFFGLKDEMQPFILFYRDISKGILVKLKPGTNSLSEIDNSIHQLKAKWEEVFPKSTFTYTFVDEKFASLYNEERMFGKVFMLFTILAIFIASLGLFGLAYYRCLVRTKEIGIRKVNGARVTEVMAMLNRDFIKWVAIAFVIACPIAWYAMYKWLENFAYKTELSWWVFAAAGVIALVIALVTVSWQSWRTATRNPVESLRYE
jgi:putative ABC transport system permease protein